MSYLLEESKDESDDGPQQQGASSDKINPTDFPASAQVSSPASSTNMDKLLQELFL